LAVLGVTRPGCTQPRNSRLHRRPRMLTLGPSAWAMAHCTLISRSIQKHDDCLGGRPAANSMLRPRGCGTKPTHPTHHSLRCHLTPPGTMQDATVPPAGTHPRHSSLLLRSTLYRARVCSAGPVPTVGSGVARVALAQLVSTLDGCFRVFWPATAHRPNPLPSPALTLPCVSQMSFQTSVKWKAEGWGRGQCRGAAASCQAIETT
jgi:hypothetical protein